MQPNCVTRGSSAEAASVAMCCRMASWLPSTLIFTFSKCSAASHSAVCSFSRYSVE